MSHLGRNRRKLSYESNTFLSDMCDCILDSDVGTNDFFLMHARDFQCVQICASATPHVSGDTMGIIK